MARAAEAVRSRLKETGYRFPDHIVSIKLCAVPGDNPAEGKTRWAVRDYVRVNHDIEGNRSGDPSLTGRSYDAVVEALVAHELFHLSQAQYREHEAWTPGWVADRDLWWREGTATWFMMRFVPAYGHPAIESNCVNLLFSLNDLGWKYANASFVSYLAHKDGAEIVREAWETYGADPSDETCLSAIHATLRARGASLSADFVEYAVHYAVLRDWEDAQKSQLQDPYTGGSVLTVEACQEGTEEEAGRKVSLLPLAAWPIKLVPRGRGTLHLSLAAQGEPETPEWEAVVLTHGRRGWSIHSRMLPGGKPLDIEDFGSHVREVAVVPASTRWTGETQKVSVTATCTTKREPIAEAKRALRRMVDALERWRDDCGMYPHELTDLLRTDEPSYHREWREDWGRGRWNGPYLPGGVLPVNPFTGGRKSGRDWRYFVCNNVRVLLDMPYEPDGRLFAQWSSFGWAPAGEVAGYKYFDRSGRRIK